MAFILAVVLCTRAGDAVSGFTNGTDFAQYELGQLDPNQPDPDRSEDPGIYWLRAEKSDRAVIATDESASSEPYLVVDLDTPLERLALPRQGDDSVSNALLKTSVYDGIYFDSHVRLMPAVDAPDAAPSDKVVVWLREAEQGDGSYATNLVVMAGYYAGGFKNVVSTNYVIESPSVAAGAWHRLTIAAISDITGVRTQSGQFQGTKNPGFAIYIDGTQAVARAGSSVGHDYDKDFLTPEARVLIGERGLFPWLVRGGQDAAMTLSRCALSGRVSVGDLLFTTGRPDGVPPGNVFTLTWDAGVAAMRCIVSNAAEVVTNDHVVAECPDRYWDYRLGTNVDTVVTVTNVAYKADCGYSNGVWSVERGCRLVGGSFVCDGTSDNPVGRVASSRDVVGVGAGVGYETFAEAKLRAMEKAREKGETTARVALNTNWVVTAAKYGAFKDGGTFAVTNGDDVVLDLNGHTLTGGGTVPTISHRGGKLRIVDSVGGGAVFPPTNSSLAVALRSEAYAAQGVKAGHELVVEAGRYAGEVQLTGGGNNRPYCGTCVVEGGAYTNVFGAAAGFYLASYVTNAAYYALSTGDYWACATNGFVWCGKGADARWDTPANWRGGVVPGADDLAVFPRAAEPWAVDFGTGAPFKAVVIDGDVALSGTNVFSDVKLVHVGPFVPGGGRLVGSGTAAFTNALPGKLTGEYAGDGEIRLGADWSGTVRIGGIATATNLVDLARWGQAGSKVEFNGVRGYLSDRKGLSLPFELVLTDDGATPAWRNETGYTGSTIVFPRLSGTGTFDSPANLRDVRQVYRFEDVSDFSGRFLMGGKRLVLGAATPQGTDVGDITFADGVSVRTGKDLGWQAATAYFGKTLRVTGETNDVLMTYTSDAAPEVREVTVCRTGADGVEATNWLAVVGKTVRVSGVKPPASAKMLLGAKAVYATEAGAAAKSGTTLGILPGSAVAIVGNDVMVDGWVVSSVAGYYNVTGDAQSGYSVAFDEPAVKPAVVDFAVSEGAGGIAEVVVQNAKAGLWYGVETRASLAAEDWAAPAEWTLAEEDGELYLPAPKAGDSGGFYRVIVTDREP